MTGLRGVGLALLAAGLLFGPAARAGGSEVEEMGRAAEKKVDYLDRLGRFERQQIGLAQLALQRSQSPRVREFATQLIRDHQKNLRTLRTWAQGRAEQVAALGEDGMLPGTGGSGARSAVAAGEKDSEKHLEKANAQSLEAEEKRHALSEVKLEEFDGKFLSQVMDSQKQGLELLEEGKKKFGGDLTLVTLLSKSQPVLEGHVAHAKSLKDVMD